jgi:hypothetical protein
MDDIDPDKREAALLARLEAEREQRLAEKVEAGEIVSVALSVVVGTASQIAAAVEAAKADKLKELRAAGETREIVFGVHTAVTGVCRPGENAGAPAWKPMSPPYLPLAGKRDEVVGAEEVVREEPQPPIIESYISVQTRACRDDDDAGEISEGWYSIDGKVLAVTDASGKYVGSRAMLKGEDARVVAKQLLREKKVPEGESFNRRLSYPNAGLA